MATRHRALPEDLKQLLNSIQRGQLFALQDSLKAGARIRVAQGPGKNLCLLHEAIRTGFHSMVEELLRIGGWSQPELADALNLARARKRYDIADLLVSHGAQARQLDFQTCCQELDLGAMERHLRAGTDPNRENAFAEALCTIKARPLLRFYRQFRAEFPALDDQAALALSDAVQQNQVRWTALLAWAGADPFRPVPNDLSGSFPVDSENCTTAAREALWRNDPQIMKVLRLNPTPEKAAEFLKEAAYRANSTLFRSLISKANPAVINDTHLGGSRALDGLLRRAQNRSAWSTDTETNGETDTLRCIEMLLDAGAKWRPQAEELRSIRRALLKHDSRYIVQVVRLLLYTPGAVDVPQFLEFCRYQPLASQIAAADAHLHEELKELRKSARNVSASDAGAKTETAPAVVEPPHTSPPVLPPAGQVQPPSIPPAQ
jgi:hypothetical protein